MYNIILGNSYDYIKGIEDKSIDLIITDPPYLLTPHSVKRVEGNELSKSIDKLSIELSNQGLDEGIDSSILNEFMRIMKRPNIYIWCNKKQILSYLNFFVGEHQCKFEVLLWIKSNPIPLYGPNYLNDKEYCLYFRKGVRLHTTYSSGKTYWITPTNQKDKKIYGHPTVKPLPIIEQLVQNSTNPGDTVADFFLGSGTTGVAAIRNGRNFIGVEKEEKYYKIAVNRIKMMN